jgi:hypothetical protein
MLDAKQMQRITLIFSIPMRSLAINGFFPAMHAFIE